MTADFEALSRRRRLLENPYAHVEQLYESEIGAVDFEDPVRRSRRLLQDPYAHIEHLEAAESPLIDFDGDPTNPGSVERFVRLLQRRLWESRESLWPENAPIDPIDALDAGVAASLAGFDFQIVDSLGSYIDSVDKFEVAGCIERSTRTICISRAFSAEEQRFTGAHELAHAFMHREMEALHRDRGLDGSRVIRDAIEFQADKFATYFLMPAKLMTIAFVHRFLTPRFSLSEETAFALLNKPLVDAPKLLSRRRDLARALASASQFNGKNFESLAEYFRVSREAMAIRLEELNLIAP